MLPGSFHGGAVRSVQVSREDSFDLNILVFVRGAVRPVQESNRGILRMLSCLFWKELSLSLWTADITPDKLNYQRQKNCLIPVSPS